MANGDRLFGPNGASGAVTGTGALIQVPLDFSPQWVELTNSVNGSTLYWWKDMPNDSGLLGGLAGGGGVTSADSAGTPAGVNGTSAVTGTAAAQVFIGTAPTAALNLATPRWSGTGLTAAGQVITTTDNQTMLLNEAAGMWLISATGATAPNLILSNTAVAAAPAVLTVQGSANTDAGAYQIVTGVTPAGTNKASALTATAGAQAFTGSLMATHTHTSPAGGGGSFVIVDGITPGNNGFIIGANASINILGDNMYWNAGR